MGEQNGTENVDIEGFLKAIARKQIAAMENRILFATTKMAELKKTSPPNQEVIKKLSEYLEMMKAMSKVQMELAELQNRAIDLSNGLEKVEAELRKMNCNI